ncbi:methyl-accepting chemotaxis protein [Pseudomonas segetis]|uniref:Methyl-accepting chemotaxis protein n=1 Tax=Pseudomonas segetis TaxID=298908 RepID=A0A239DJ21_9PSED|nr:methyl-accepting chemotaxis protein [Pseudomonas segetis]SNS32001.1 Methyl-accepting chemotaxis protein [Pseudomonas segetis]
MFAIASLLRSRLLRPVFIALGLALLVQVLVAVMLTRTTVSTLVEDLSARLGSDTRQLSTDLEAASAEVRGGLEGLSSRTQASLGAGLKERLSAEQVQLRGILESNLKQSADDLAQLLAAVAPKAIWDNDVPALTELVRMAHRNSNVLFAVYVDAGGERLTRHVNRTDERVKALIAKGQGRGSLDKLLNAAASDPGVYVVEASINPMGSEIGKVILGVSTVDVDKVVAQLDQRFAALIQSSGQLVSDGLSAAASDSAAALASRLKGAQQTAQAMAENSRQAIESAAQSLRWNISIGLALVGLVILLVLALVLGRRVVSKLHTLIAVMDDWAAGEGDLTRRVQMNSRDEIGDMAAVVNRFVGKLQPIVREAGDIAVRTGVEIESLAVRSAAAEVSAARQRDEVAGSLHALAQMADEAQAESQSMQEALQRVGSIRQATEDNSAIARRVGGSIAELVDSVDTGAAVIQRLARQSEQIEVVLTVIHGIAEQTNLLALNAAIEAARAGESGRGFAVVADEVRALASKTQQSTGDIQAHIGALQQGAREAVSAIEQASRQAAQGLAALNESERLQGSVQVSVEEVHGAINAAAGAARHQAEGAAAVRRRVEVIHAESQRAAEAVAATAKSGRVLDGLASQLSLSLGQFKV